MPSIKNTKRQTQPPPGRKHYVALAMALLLLYGALHAAQPPMTPAGTIIRNHAIIQFQRVNDEVEGRIYDAPSNEVLIEVLPVYNIEILPDGDAPGGGIGALPGQTIRTVSTTDLPNTRVVISYSLYFTGNASDNVHIVPDFAHAPSTFLPQLPDGDTGMLVFSDIAANGVLDSDDVQIASWRDSNSNGQIDTGEVQLTPLGRQFPPGTVFPLLLVFRVPTNTPAGRVCYVGIKGSSASDPNAKDPASPTAIQNIAKVEIVDDAVMTVTKSAKIVGVPPSSATANIVSPGGTITYTLTGKSIGKADAKKLTLNVNGGSTYQGVVLFDAIPTVSGTSQLMTISDVSITSPVAHYTIIYSSQDYTGQDLDSPSWNWHTSYDSANDRVIAYISSDGANHHDLIPGSTVTLTFNATIPTGQGIVDQTLLNVGHASYDTNGLGVQKIRSTNEVPVYVRTTTGVIIRDTDFEASKPPLTPGNDSTVDFQTVPEVQAGTFVYFTNRIINTGGYTNKFNITLEESLSSYPSNWSVSFFKSDGLTPLRDSGVHGTLDTGPIEPAGADTNNPDAFIDIVMRVEIPEDAKPSVGDPEYKAVYVLKACAATGECDITTNRIGTVKAANMRLDNHHPVESHGQWEDALTKTGDPGKYVIFPLVVQNLAPDGLDGGEVDVYTLSTPIPLPTGWSVTYYRDLNGNGVLDPNELLPVLRSGNVAPQGKDYLIARVWISPDAIADGNGDGNQDEYSVVFRATSSNLPNLYADQEDIVMVNWQDRFELQPNRQGTIEPNGVAIYEHTVTNFGERANTFFLTLTPGNANWTYFLLRADSGEELPKDTDPSGGGEKYFVELGKAGAPNDKATFRLRIYAPGGIPQGTMDLSSILVTANNPKATNERFDTIPLHIVTDVTFVVAGDLVLTKSANPTPGAAVSPGQQITYTTIFFNKSADALAQLTIQDQISRYTAYVLKSAKVDPLPDGVTGVTFEVSRNGGISWTADAGSGSDLTVTNVRAVFTGALRGGAQGEFEFKVLVR
jgi:uncharacterized repeat protein (TIGR01451 family)